MPGIKATRRKRLHQLVLITYLDLDSQTEFSISNAKAQNIKLNIQDQRTNGPVNAHLRSATYAS